MKVLAIGDPHEPVCRDGYLRFCKKIYRKYNCNKVVIIGDIVDWHGISFHAKHPHAPSSFTEYGLAKKGIKKWYKAFPKASVCIGNHDSRVIRLAESVNIPEELLKEYNDAWDTPKWKWDFDFTIDSVQYTHGIGYGGLHPAFNAARHQGMSVVMGHIHSVGGTKWCVSSDRRWFGMDVGCGIDDKKYAFAYGKHIKRKSVISCGVVLNGMPYHEMMPLENYK